MVNNKNWTILTKIPETIIYKLDIDEKVKQNLKVIIFTRKRGVKRLKA